MLYVFQKKISHIHSPNIPIFTEIFILTILYSFLVITAQINSQIRTLKYVPNFGGINTNTAKTCEPFPPFVSLKESHLKFYRNLLGALISLSSLHLGYYEFSKPATRYIVVTKNNSN